MAFAEVIVNYHPAEWWYAHLGNGLEPFVNVQRWPLPAHGDAGIDWAENCPPQLQSGDASKRLFVGSVDALHGWLPTLPCATAVYYDYFPDDLEHLGMLGLFDAVFITSRDGERRLEQMGLRNVRWLPHAYDDTLLSPQPLERIYDVGFVGATNLPTHARRRALLPQLAALHRLNDYQRPVFGEDMYRVYRQSKIAVNIANLGSFNMRVFEAMACGCLLVTEKIGHGLLDLFEDGKHLVVYHNDQELFAKVDYYLKHPQEREAIARAGQAEVLAKHSYRQRAQRLLACAEELGPQRLRTTDPNTLARAYAVFYHRRRRSQLLLRLLRRPGLAFSTRAFVWQRWLRSCAATLRRSVSR